MNFIYLAFNIKVNLSQLIKMLNGNKEIDYRHILKYTECVVLCDIYCIIVWHVLEQKFLRVTHSCVAMICLL